MLRKCRATSGRCLWHSRRRGEPRGGRSCERGPVNIAVELGERRYDVVVRDGARNDLKTLLDDRAPRRSVSRLVTSGSLETAPWFDFDSGREQFVIRVPEGEAAKSMDVLLALLEELADAAPLARRRRRRSGWGCDHRRCGLRRRDISAWRLARADPDIARRPGRRGDWRQNRRQSARGKESCGCVLPAARCPVRHEHAVDAARARTPERVSARSQSAGSSKSAASRICVTRRSPH